MSICCNLCKKKKPQNIPTITFSNPNSFEYELCTVNTIDYNGNTSLHNAKTPQQYMRELLNDKSINVNIKNKDGNTPLHTCDSPELAVMLLASGADADAKNNNNQTPVSTAKDDVQREIIKQFSMSNILMK